MTDNTKTQQTNNTTKNITDLLSKELQKAGIRASVMSTSSPNLNGTQKSPWVYSKTNNDIHTMGIPLSDIDFVIKQLQKHNNRMEKQKKKNASMAKN